MNDRERLELAAKAVGINGGLIGKDIVWKEGNCMMFWNPRTDFLKKERDEALKEAADICDSIAGCSYAGNAPTLRDVAKVLRHRP